ncbi:MAG: hypothetical protein ACI87J_002706 [Colwellia sp.]|jgi:hypothetical protein
MVLTERKEHIPLLAKMIASKGINIVELHGGDFGKQATIAYRFFINSR